MISQQQIDVCLAAFNAGATLAAAARAAGMGTISARRAIRGQLPIQLRGHHANLGRPAPRHPLALRAEAAPHVTPKAVQAAAEAIRNTWPPEVRRARMRRADAALVELARRILQPELAAEQ